MVFVCVCECVCVCVCARAGNNAWWACESRRLCTVGMHEQGIMLCCVPTELCQHSGSLALIH